MWRDELVSVIVSVYDVSDYINECLESIVQQTYSNIEIIVVDDGSNDSSAEICDEWQLKDNRIKVFHKQNGGLSDARNYALEKSKGDYICFVDGDDRLTIDFVEKMYTNLIENNADLCVCHYFQNCLQEGNLIYSMVYSKNVECVDWQKYMEIVYNNTYYVTACMKLGKRELYHNNMFPIGKKHEDAFVILDVVRKCTNICIIPEHLYFYRNREDSIMNDEDECLYLDDFEWINNHIVELEKDKLSKLVYEAKKLFCHNFIKNRKKLNIKNQKSLKKIYNKYYGNIIFSSYMPIKSRVKYLTIGLPIW